MQRSKPLTVSAQLVPGRDDELIKYLQRPEINQSAVIRAALYEYIGGEPAKEKDSQSTNIDTRLGGNPFLSASP